MKPRDELGTILDNLQQRVRAIEKSYNPDNLNLHFDIPARSDSVLFEELYSVATEAWRIIKVNQSRQTAHWFYNFFLLIKSASIKILNDDTQKYYSADVIERMALLLTELSEMTDNREFEGDITKRNDEALGYLLIAFNNLDTLNNKVLIRAEVMNSQGVIHCVNWSIKTAEQIKSKRNAPTPKYTALSFWNDLE